MFASFRRWLHRNDPPRPFPADWAEHLSRNVPVVARLSAEDRAELEQLTLLFLDEKHFEGAGGLELTDEIRLTIASQACLLLLHRDTDVYPGLDTIVVYPSTYHSNQKRQEGAVVIEGDVARLGESWNRGVVVLAWDAVLRGTRTFGDGHNVVLHELAHQLDAEDGAMDGAPALDDRARYLAWAKILGAEYEELVAKVEAGRRTDIDGYGATSPPEFFAVVTEAFFERPASLKARHPDLYAELAAFYAQDPAALDANGTHATGDHGPPS